MSFFNRKKPSRRDTSPPVTIYNISGGERTRKSATKHEKLEGVDTFTGDKTFDRAVARRVIGLKVAVQRVSGPKNVKQMQEQDKIHSMYRAYVAKDEVYKNMSPKQKAMIEKADDAIERYYNAADREREKQFDAGQLPVHRSINLHHKKNIKQERFTPNARVAKEEKLKLEKKLGFKIDGELSTDDDEKSRFEEVKTTVKKKKKFLL